LIFSRNITLILKNTNEFFSSDADIHFGSSSFLPINSSILYEGYVLGKTKLSRTRILKQSDILDLPESSYVSGGFYSNCFDGIIKLSNETWHIEPSRKYGIAGSSIIYNALDVDMTKYNSNEAFRYKRYVINEDEDSSSSSFCGLDDDKKRRKMREEAERLTPNEYDFSRTKRQTTNNAEQERTCCYIYIRVDPTLWDVVYKNEGLNVNRSVLNVLNN
jgi:hypothetical protein